MQSLQELKGMVEMGTEFHFGRREIAVATVDKDRIVFAGPENSAVWNHQSASEARCDGHSNVHADFEKALRIRETASDLGGTRHRVQRLPDEVIPTFKFPSGIGADSHSNGI